MQERSLREELLALRHRDQTKRSELVERGALWDGYHPEMEAVHRRNARVLAGLLREKGWPPASEVGEEGAEAAWMVALHAIAEPAFQRQCRELLRNAVERGEARASHLAGLVDRIRFNERRPQVYGTILDWDENGLLSAWHLEDPEGVEERRSAVGLRPLEESVRESREIAKRERATPPQSFAERQAEILAWSRRVGWVAD